MKMLRNYIYVLLAALGIIFSCQRVELPEDSRKPSPEEGVYGKATISFSAMLPSQSQTKSMGDDPFGEDTDDISSMHLVIFDGNGMLVETCEATLAESNTTHDSDIASDSEPHLYETEFSVTLTMSDQPRIVHFIANCPVEQIAYGHETSIIGNMYVEKDTDSSTPETAYWARIEVDDLIIEDTDTDNPHFANDDVANAFKCVPMLRNFAQITVDNSDSITVPDGHTFVYEGFTLYNTVDIGTVAPYNNKSGEFQSFIDPETKLKYKYPDFMGFVDGTGRSISYEGHALAAAELNQSLEINPQYANSNDDALKYKWYTSGESFYMYERKISIKTNDESMWNESPPHLIIKGKYDGQTCYYKVDLVYKVIENGEAREIKYYNILRNFKYKFTITKVDSKGYNSVQEAVRGATSNNLAGSATTSKFTNISDNVGRLWVSHTSKTLVTDDDITLYYRYEPELGSGVYNNNRIDQTGGVIFFEDADGNAIEGSNVIKQFTIADTDETTGEWAGYRRVDIKINTPQAMAKEQTIVLRTDKATLARYIQYTLRNKYRMVVDCTPAVLAKIGEDIQLDIKLPGGLTANMFPLALRIEVADMTLSPNAEENTIPVKVGTSIVSGKEGTPAFFYVWTLQTKDEYDNLTPDGTSRVINTHWLTNIAKSASTIYVSNDYFMTESDSFLNGVIFSNVEVRANNSTTRLDRLFYGANEKVDITFTMSSDDNNYQNKEVTVLLNGLADADGNTQLNITPGSNRTVTISDLVTTSLDGNVSFTVSHPEYISVTSQEVIRYPGTFSDLQIGDGRAVLKGDGVKTSISFNMDDTDQNYTNRTVIVQFDGLVDEKGNSEREISLAGYTGRTVTIDNLYTINANGNISFSVREKNNTYTSAISKIYGRRDRAFKDVKLEPESVNASTEEAVTFEFTIAEEEFTAGMVVNVDMVGLRANTTGQAGQKDVLVATVTRATENSYTFEPSAAGTYTFDLLTTDAQAGTCSVTISAEGFSTADDTIEQRDIVTYSGTLSVTIDDINIRHNQNNNNPKPTIRLKSINVGGTDINGDYEASYVSHTASLGGRRYTLTSVTFDIKNLVISGKGLTDDTQISVTVTIKYGNTSNDYTIKYKLSDITNK